MMMTTNAGALLSPRNNAPCRKLPGIAETIAVAGRKRGSRLLLFFMLLVFGATFAAKAAIIPVTNSNDAGAGSLRQAIISAANFDVIEFSGVGTVTLTSGELLVNKPLTINGGTGVTITRSGTTAFRLMTIGSGFSVTIRNLKFTNGKADYGGAIYNNSNFLLLDKCIFSANTATAQGGALYNNNASTKVTNSLFQDNKVEVPPPVGVTPCSAPTGLNASGIGLSAATVAWGGVPNATKYVVTYKWLVRSSTTGESWFETRTIDAGTNTTVEITGLNLCQAYTWFVTATCTSGSSVASAEATFVTTGCRSGGGGGILERVATTKPGAKVVQPNKNGTIAGQAPTLQIALNSTASTLETSVTGGAAIASNGGSPQVTNCTFYGNAATTGGAILNVATVAPVITNCIIWGNSAGGIVNTASAATVSYSIVQGGYVGTGNLAADPLFVDAAAGNFNLQPCSPAVNSGNNTVDFSAPVDPSTCGAPTGLLTTGITSSVDLRANTFYAASLAWTGVPNATRYVITLKEYTRDFGVGTTIQTSTYDVGNVTSFTVQPLYGACKLHTWVVTAYCISGASATSTEAEFTPGRCSGGGGGMLTRANLSINVAEEVQLGSNSTLAGQTATSHTALNTSVSTASTTSTSGTTDLVGNPRIVNIIIDMGAYELQSGACVTTATWYKDADNDGYSDGTTQQAATKPEGYKAASELTATTGDCNDAVAAINPGATEICGNSFDENCDGQLNEGCCTLVANTSSLADVKVECSVASLTAPTATNSCGGVVTGTPDITFPITTQGTIVVTWSYISGNNTLTQTQNVIIDDVTAPVAPTLAAATGECSVTVTAPTAQDNCKGTITGTSNDPVSYTAQGSYTITWTFNDGNGNTSTATQSVVVDDVTAPVPNVATLAAATGECSVTVTAPTATDNCKGAVTGTTTSPLTYTAQGTYSITWSFNDGNGNISTQTQSVVVDDVTLPVANTASLSNVTAQCSVNSLTAPTATDNCKGQLTATTATSLPIIAQGTTIVTWTYNDGNGNTATQTQIVVITDNTAPVVSGCPSNISINTGAGSTTCNGTATWTAPTATDNCTTPVTVTSTHNSGDAFPVGSTTVTYTFKDAALNTSTCSFTVTVVDNTPPTANALTAVNVQCISGIPAANIAAVTGETDNCGGVVTVAHVSDANNGGAGSTASPYIITRTYSLTDARGNTTNITQTLTAKDNTAPVPNVATLAAATGECSVTVTAPTATDNCKGAVTGTTTSPLTYTAQGTYSITWTYNDGNGNLATQTQNVIVKDVTAPVLSDIVPNQSTLWPPNHKMKDVTLTYSASDNCGGIPSCITTVSSNEEADNDLGDGNTEVDWEVVNSKLVRLRAERSGTGEGRVYTITVTCNDGNGNVTSKTTQVRIAHNITSPVPGSSVKIGTTINMAGTFWDVAGNKHTAKWLVDGATVSGTVVSEPVGTKNGTVKGSYKLATAGVYKLQMNITDQKGVTSYATTSGYDEAIVVAYDPNGGYTYGGKKYKSPKGAMPSNPAVGGEMTYGFQTNYYKGATNPKGETWFILNNGEFEFNALNFEYLAVSGAKAQFRGLGKMNRNGVEQSGIAFILTVIDGQLAGGGGTDKIRMKIFNKNSGEIYYDSQMGASDADNPTIVVENNSLGDGVVVVNTTTTTTANPVTVAPVQLNTIPVEVGETKFDLKAFPNPSTSQITLQLQSNVREKVQLRVTDISGRTVQMLHNLDANQSIQIGKGYRPGVYIVEMIQGSNRKQVKLIKQ